MKIAVCVKQVPEGTKRIDPATKRLDRSGEGALNVGKGRIPGRRYRRIGVNSCA